MTEQVAARTVNNVGERVKFGTDGLVTAVIQDFSSGQVLMVGYMNAAALQKTIDTGVVWFFSRSRQRLWQKGETSGNVLKVREMRLDCDGDAILVRADAAGPVCHEGTASCFSRILAGADGDAAVRDEAQTEGNAPAAALPAAYGAGVLYELYDVILDRKLNPREGSYTCYLFEKGRDKILKKVGEEAAETIIASKNGSRDEILYEMADLWYHCLVLLAHHGLAPTELMDELRRRRK